MFEIDTLLQDCAQISEVEQTCSSLSLVRSASSVRLDGDGKFLKSKEIRERRWMNQWKYPLLRAKWVNCSGWSSGTLLNTSCSVGVVSRDMLLWHRLTSRSTNWGLLAINPARLLMISRGKGMWSPEKENIFNPERRSNGINVNSSWRPNGGSTRCKISWRSWSFGSLVKPQMTAASVHDESSNCTAHLYALSYQKQTSRTNYLPDSFEVLHRRDS